MKLKEFVDKALGMLNTTNRCHDGSAEFDVVIETSQRVWSGQNHVDVKGIFWGMDFDARRIIITPEREVVPNESHRDVAKKPFDAHIPDQYKTKIKPYFVCPECEEPLKKTFRYCPRCGQKIDRESKYAVSK